MPDSRNPRTAPARGDILDGPHNSRTVRAVTDGDPVRVTYVGKDGKPTTITLAAWCRWAAAPEVTVRVVGGGA